MSYCAIVIDFEKHVCGAVGQDSQDDDSLDTVLVEVYYGWIVNTISKAWHVLFELTIIIITIIIITIITISFIVVIIVVVLTIMKYI